MGRMPTDAEIQAAGEKLGHGPGPYPTKIRAQIAKTITMAEGMERTERATEAVSASFGAAVARVYQDLRRNDLSASLAEAVTAAVAPTIYRNTEKQENTAP